ncbi:hypothetical protein [Aminivibrio pyruvatiphilus]|jgi:hypothetical protein|uniref:hypothetical protein n=1 Tax=Aminivibrio pyruvatiphilus TaxID=1005740 RepID=UPI00106343FE|nr:hypothetical protein [Aminivibrio pyruvatiphilus]
MRKKVLIPPGSFEKIYLIGIAFLFAVAAAFLRVVQFKEEVLRMKRFWKFPVMAFIFTALLFGALPAFAKDSGDERVIEVIRWECFVCGKQYFTFAPDDIGGKTKAEHKIPDYQQKNWVMFSDPGKSISKCPKSGDDAHMFFKKEEFKTSPYIVHERKNDYVVLKNGGPIKTKIKKWRCGLCKKDGFCFDGDDMDLWEGLIFKNPQKVFNMGSGSSIPVCNFKLITGEELKCHMVTLDSAKNYPSIEIAKLMSNLWYSD